MTFNHISKMTIFLHDQRYLQNDWAEILGKNTVPPAMTIIITGMHDEVWHLGLKQLRQYKPRVFGSSCYNHFSLKSTMPFVSYALN